MRYKRGHNILLTILILGLINLYNIYKYGGTIYPLVSDREELGSLRIGVESIVVSIGIVVSILLLISVSPYFNTGEKGVEKKELEILIGTSMIGIIGGLYSNELILLYLGLELYNYSNYILLLKKESGETRRVSIVYLIISSILSGILLLSFLYIYRYTGTLNYSALYTLHQTLGLVEGGEVYGIIVLCLIIKIGVMPFTSWFVRLYKAVDRSILLYQLIIPKVLLLTILYRFLALSFPSSFLHPGWIDLLLLAIGSISLVGGGIGGLYHREIPILLTYSSILNIGYILVGISINTMVNGNNTEWVVYNYLYIYIFNLIGLFSVFFLYNRSSNIFSSTLIFKYPFLYGCMLILILSFIGIPPLSGFYGKIYLLLTYLQHPSLAIYSLAIGIFILGSLISTFIYLKFLLPSSYLLPQISTPTYSDLDPDTYYLSSSTPIISTYILAFTVFFSFFYSFFLPSLYPLLLSISPLSL